MQRKQSKKSTGIQQSKQKADHGLKVDYRRKSKCLTQRNLRKSVLLGRGG